MATEELDHLDRLTRSPAIKQEVERRIEKKLLVITECETSEAPSTYTSRGVLHWVILPCFYVHEKDVEYERDEPWHPVLHPAVPQPYNFLRKLIREASRPLRIRFVNKLSSRGSYAPGVPVSGHVGPTYWHCFYARQRHGPGELEFQTLLLAYMLHEDSQRKAGDEWREQLEEGLFND